MTLNEPNHYRCTTCGHVGRRYAAADTPAVRCTLCGDVIGGAAAAVCPAPIDTLQLGAAGVGFEREINRRLRSENDRLREALTTIRGMMVPTVPGGVWEVANEALAAEPSR